MKTLMLLFLIVSCGGSGGGSSSGSPAANNTTPVVNPIHEYRFVAQGAQGTSFVSDTYVNFAESDQTNLAFSVSIDASNAADLAIFGRTAFWQVQKTGGGLLTLIILRDGVEVARDTIAVDGQVVTLTDNI